MTDAALGAASRYVAAAATAKPSADTVALLRAALRMAEEDASGSRGSSSSSSYAGEAAMPPAAEPQPERQQQQQRWRKIAAVTRLSAVTTSAPREVQADAAPPKLVRGGSHGSYQRCTNRKAHNFQHDWNTGSMICIVCKISKDEVEDEGDAPPVLARFESW